MSRSYGNFITPEDDWYEWQPYLMPNSRLTHRAPPPEVPPHWVVVERDRVERERQMAARLRTASSSSSGPSHFAEQHSPPSYYEFPYEPPPSELGPSLTKKEQEKAIKKLRKVMYNPHLSNIVKRLGMKHGTNQSGTNQSGTSGCFQDEEGKRCAICLDDFNAKEFVMVTPCDHMFHEECIVPWVMSQGKCPVCRSMICEKEKKKKEEAPESSSRRRRRHSSLDRDLAPIIRQFNQRL